MNPMLAQGVELMLVGMGVVFAFLVMLVVAVALMSRLVARYAPDAVPAAPAAAPSLPPPGPVDARTLAVIREAVRLHRERA